MDAILGRKKDAERFVCLTAYTTPMAQALSPYVDLLLVGDSVGMVLYGMTNTVGVDLEMMIRHGQAVMRGRLDNVPVVVDMPAGTYEASPEQALATAQRLVAQTGCDAVKLEGGAAMAAHISAITQSGIAVMGHIGLLPQSVIKEGGFKIKGKTAEEIQNLENDALAVQSAGAFALVIEGTRAEGAQKITRALDIPSIGIGASAACDGQILVSEDLLGMSYGRPPKFVKQYAALSEDIERAAKAFARDVRSGAFPSSEYLY